MSIKNLWNQIRGRNSDPVQQPGASEPPGSLAMPKLSELVDGHICLDRYERIDEIAKNLVYMTATDLPKDQLADLVEFSKCQRCIFYLSEALKDEGTRLQNLGL